MADITGNWSRMVNMRSVDPNEKLFLFGYSCKVFRDDEKATYIDQGKHLIPWMGDEKLMIDRYDVRGYLHDLKQYEPPVSGNYEDPYLEEEKLCDEERYRSLRTDVSEEQLYQEEELKRLRAAIASDGAYHEIGFTYDNTESEKYEEPAASKVEEPEDELYQVPAGLKVPKGMEVPYNMKIHAIIEKTAQFVSEQGGQMEIIIKMKQHANPQFAFMHLDNPLYPYYKHLVKEIKSGSYKPAQIKKTGNHSEDDDDDGHYLHPSLMSGKAEDVPKFTVPSINFRRNHDDSYSVLVRNLRQHLVEEKPVETHSSSTQASLEGHTKNNLVSICSDESSCDEYQNNSVRSVELIPPPPDLQPIIHKMAEYVAKNGEDFETIVKSKNDDRFAFLHPWNEYYQYYVLKRDEAKGKVTEIVKQSEQPSVQVSESDSSKTVSNDPVQDSGTDAVSPEDNKEENQVPDNCENEAMDSQDSQGSVFGPNPEPSQEILKEDQTDSMESLDSQSSIQSTQEGGKSKSKSIKAPISFSLKVKESETPTSDKSKLTTLLMDDSEDDSDENKADKVESDKRRKSTDDSRSAPNSRHESVEREEKTTKQNNESLEAKLAEDRIKDKLVAAARERIAQQKKEKQMQLEQQKREELLKKEKQAQLEQQKKEKQLQLERKRKAALFLKMLEKKNPDLNVTASQKLSEKKEINQENLKKSVPAELDSDFWILPDAAGASDNGIVFPSDKMYISSGQNFPLTVQGLKHAWATNSFSGESGEEEPITEYGEKHSSDSEPVVAKVEVAKPEKQKKKKKKRSHSKSRERSRSDRSKASRRSRERHRSRSPIKNHKEKSKRDKELPAAYSYKRSRSRSRSPRRYRPGPSHWSRRR